MTSASAPAAQPIDGPDAAQTKPHGLAVLTLGAIGVVYGDIGTSPLYTIKEIFSPHTGVALNAANLIGAVSVIFWALMLVVTFKYVILILRADNRGEGGALALTALASHAVSGRPALRRALLLLGVFGATLFYGDGIITPAISVLGAMEGLEVVTPALKPYVVPASVAVLLALFLFQRFGTSTVGKVFGPVRSFVERLGVGGVHRAARTAVYAVAERDTVPQALLHNLKHNQVLHERNVILTVEFHDVPWIEPDRRVQVEPLGHDFWRVTAHFGFMDTPDVPKALALCEAQGLRVPPSRRPTS